MLVNNIRPLPTIVCAQRKASKKVVTELDIIAANKISFGDSIGPITNRITNMFNVQAGFNKDSMEYKALEYRIMCGQLYQQNSIDKAKGIIAKPMPKHWYDMSSCKIEEDDSFEEIEAKEFNKRILANKKPYFFIYNYPSLKKEYDTFLKDQNKTLITDYNMTLKEFFNTTERNLEEKDFYYYFDKENPILDNACVTNQIAHKVENSMVDFKETFKPFDYYDLKNEDYEYSNAEFAEVERLLKDFKKKLKHLKAQEALSFVQDYDEQVESLKQNFIDDIEVVCPNKYSLSNILIDILYTTTNSNGNILWDYFGDVIIENLMRQGKTVLNYPSLDDNGTISFKGMKFTMKTLQIGGEL